MEICEKALSPARVIGILTPSVCPPFAPSASLDEGEDIKASFRNEIYHGRRRGIKLPCNEGVTRKLPKEPRLPMEMAIRHEGLVVW